MHACVCACLQQDGDQFSVKSAQSNLSRLRNQAKLASSASGTAVSSHKEWFCDSGVASLGSHFPNDFLGTQSVIHAYLRHCRDRGLAPESFFLRKKLSSTLDLRHYSIGSERTAGLALVLASLPMLQVWLNRILVRPVLYFSAWESSL